MTWYCTLGRCFPTSWSKSVSGAVGAGCMPGSCYCRCLLNRIRRLGFSLCRERLLKSSYPQSLVKSPSGVSLLSPYWFFFFKKTGNTGGCVGWRPQFWTPAAVCGRTAPYSDRTGHSVGPCGLERCCCGAGIGILHSHVILVYCRGATSITLHVKYCTVTVFVNLSRSSLAMYGRAWSSLGPAV